MSKCYDNPEYDTPRGGVQNTWKHNYSIKQVPIKECDCNDNTCDYCEEQESIQILKEAKEQAIGQKTLEEVAEKMYDDSSNIVMDIDISDSLQSAFIDGAKWQQEQDKNKFSNEEVLNVLREFYKTFDPIKNPPQTSTIPLWFEQFEKK